MTPVRLLLCALLINAQAALAADASGNFAMKGAGFLPCKVYVAEREKKSRVYYMIGGWVEGFLSAHNKYSFDTYDVLSFESLELVLSVMQNHCQSNPADRLYAVLNSIVLKITPDRLEKESPRVEFKVGDRTGVLYRETIRRMQAELTRLGLYKDEVDGRFTDATSAALIAFQSDLEFETSGFPDQATLWRLFRR